MRGTSAYDEPRTCWNAIEYHVYVKGRVSKDHCHHWNSRPTCISVVHVGHQTVRSRRLSLITSDPWNHLLKSYNNQRNPAFVEITRGTDCGESLCTLDDELKGLIL